MPIRTLLSLVAVLTYASDIISTTRPHRSQYPAVARCSSAAQPPPSASYSMTPPVAMQFHRNVLATSSSRIIFSPRRWSRTTACSRRSCVRICAAADISTGARVRVSQPVTVFHAPKQKSGLSLEGMEGTVTAVIKEHKGKELSANLPIRVQFILPADDSGKEGKLIAHLVRSPLTNRPAAHRPTHLDGNNCICLQYGPRAYARPMIRAVAG